MARFLGFGDGSDGAINLTSYTIIKASCSGTSGATSLSATGSFSAGQRIFICQMRGTGVGAYEDNQIKSYSTGTITLVHPLENTYTDSGASQAQVVVVPQATAITGSLTVPAWDGNVGGLAVFACSGTFSGTVNGNARGYRADNAATGVGDSGDQGEGTAGAQGAQSKNANGNGGGGGEGYSGSTRAGGGGGGGHATAGVNGHIGHSGDNQTEGGIGGTAVGTAALTTIYMGGAGGGGGCSLVGGGETAGKGGNGGAIVVVYTHKFSSIASITTNGQNGSTPTRDGLGGGGGGAGGSILIKTVSGTIGTSKVTATGGARGKGSGAGPIPGGAGSAGRIRVEACSLSGSTSPSASTSIGGHNFCSGGLFIF